MQSGKRLASSRGQKKHDLKIVLFFLPGRTDGFDWQFESMHCCPLPDRTPPESTFFSFLALTDGDKPRMIWEKHPNTITRQYGRTVL